MGGALDYLKEKLEELQEQGLALHPRTLEGPTGARARFDGRGVINLASNHHLGRATPGPGAAILDEEDVIVSARLNHASIIDGGRLSRAQIKVFEHKDAEHAD